MKKILIFLLWLFSLIIFIVFAGTIIWVRWLSEYLVTRKTSWITAQFEKQYRRIYNRMKGKFFYNKSDQYLVRQVIFNPYYSYLGGLLELQWWKIVPISKLGSKVMGLNIAKAANKYKISAVIITSVNWVPISTPLKLSPKALKRNMVILEN